MRLLSPELTLIDADLASDARAALPPARDVLAEVARHLESEPIRNLRAALAPDAVPKRRRRRAPALRLLAGGLAGVGAIAAAVLVFRPDTSELAARVPFASAATSITAPQPATPVPPGAAAVRRTAAVTSPTQFPVLTWAVDAAASRYRVGLFRDGIPLREVWTDDAQLALSSVSMPEGGPLARGAYRWVVYPVYGADGSSGSTDTADAPLAQGTFTL